MNPYRMKKQKSTKCQQRFFAMQEQAIFEFIPITNAIPLLRFSDIKTIDGAQKIIELLKEKGFNIFERKILGYISNVLEATYILQYDGDEIAQRDVRLDLKILEEKEEAK